MNPVILEIGWDKHIDHGVRNLCPGVLMSQVSQKQ